MPTETNSQAGLPRRKFLKGIIAATGALASTRGLLMARSMPEAGGQTRPIEQLGPQAEDEVAHLADGAVQ